MKKRSIRSIVLGLLLGIMIPANMITIIIYGLLYQHIKSVVIDTQKSSVEVFLGQFENQMDQVEKYISRIINDENWDALKGNPGETSYEITKVDLQKTCLDGNSRGILTYADMIGGYIYHSGENLSVYNNQDISENTKKEMREWTQKEGLHGWSLVTIGKENYIWLKYGTTNFCLTAFVGVDTAFEPWREKNENISLDLCAIGNADSNPNGITLEIPLSKMDMEAVVFIPDKYLNRMMPLQYTLLLFCILLCIALVFLLTFFLQKRVVEPLKQIEHTIIEIKEGSQKARIKNCGKTRELQAIENEFNNLMDSIYNLEIKNYKMEIENQKAQLMNLQLQINPHLLLNTLNTIYGLAEIEDYNTIQKFTMNLVKYFRYSLKRTDELVSLAQELDFVKSYGNVQAIRYPESFYIMYNVDDELLQQKIPPLIIQNFVENSIKYSGNHHMTEILVIVKKEENYLTISVCDDGKGIPDQILNVLREGKPYTYKGETHVGIYNCIRRLHLFYQEDMEFSITSHENEGTQIWMKIPCTIGEDGNESAVS